MIQPDVSVSEAAQSTEGIPYADSKFRQQRVSACRPFLTPCGAAIIYSVFAVISLSVGLIYWFASDGLIEHIYRYDDQCDGKQNCSITIDIPNDMKGPIYIYYQLTNYYQNNFMYGSSKNWDQLKGKYFKKKSDLDSCNPIITRDGDGNFIEKVLVPCGSVPLSVFNDTFEILPQDGSSAEVPVSEHDISLTTYRKLYKPANEEYIKKGADLWLFESPFNESFGDLGQQNEHFINWMQISPFPKFRKLWGKTNSEIVLHKGKYIVNIENNYPVGSFKGTKSLIIAQVAWIGGKNNFFGIFFLAMSSFSFIAAIVFALLYWTNSLPLYKALARSGGTLEMTLLSA